LSDSFRKKPATPRNPMFLVKLVPLSKGPLSFVQPDWMELDEQRKLDLSDVGPARYRLRVYDWIGLNGLKSWPLFDRELDVPPAGRGEIRVALGAGCITRKVIAPEGSTWSLLERPVEVTALVKGSHTPARRTRCDDKGNFCVRYLSSGAHSLFINDPKRGFCRVDDVEVPAGVVDVGERALSAGATINGTIRFLRPTLVPDEVMAVHSSGVSLRQAFPRYSSCDQFKLIGLWPGRWSVVAQRGDEVLVGGEIDIRESGTFNLTLTAGGRQGM